MIYVDLRDVTSPWWLQQCSHEDRDMAHLRETEILSSYTMEILVMFALLKNLLL